MTPLSLSVLLHSSLRQVTREAVLSQMFFTGTSNLFFPHWGPSSNYVNPAHLSDRKEKEGGGSAARIPWNPVEAMQEPVMPSHLRWPQFRL